MVMVYVTVSPSMMATGSAVFSTSSSARARDSAGPFVTSNWIVVSPLVALTSHCSTIRPALQLDTSYSGLTKSVGIVSTATVTQRTVHTVHTVHTVYTYRQQTARRDTYSHSHALPHQHTVHRTSNRVTHQASQSEQCTA